MQWVTSNMNSRWLVAASFCVIKGDSVTWYVMEGAYLSSCSVQMHPWKAESWVFVVNKSSAVAFTRFLLHDHKEETFYLFVTPIFKPDCAFHPHQASLMFNLVKLHVRIWHNNRNVLISIQAVFLGSTLSGTEKFTGELELLRQNMCSCGLISVMWTVFLWKQWRTEDRFFVPISYRN